MLAITVSFRPHITSQLAMYRAMQSLTGQSAYADPCLQPESSTMGISELKNGGMKGGLL